MTSVDVLLYENGETCQWLDVDTNRWHSGEIVADRIFYDFEQVFVVSWWDDDEDEIRYTIVKRNEMKIS